MPNVVGPPPPERWRRWRSRLYEVTDASMQPVLEPGDRILVDPREYRRRPPAVGEVIALVDPEDSRRRLVKVVARWAAQEGAFVIGVNVQASRDSRVFGRVPIDRLIGPVWYRVRPEGR
ncbi:MAG: S26 family signal peptidase, partial [Thermoplasmata archaeon]